MFNHYKKLILASSVLASLSISTCVRAVDLTPDLQLHGYATVGLAKLDNHQDTVYPNPMGSGAPVIESKVSSEYDSVAGLQLNYRLNDQINLATQIYLSSFGVSDTNYVFRTNWAYVDYNFNDDWALRAGRFAISMYLYSENLRVGAAYPWARLPTELYAQLGGFYSENGVAVVYKHSFNDWMLRVQPSYGEEKLKGYKINKIKQLSASLSNDDLTLHLGSGLASAEIDAVSASTLIAGLDGSLADFGYSPTDIDQYNAALNASVKFKDVRASFLDMGFLYDDGRWFAAGELSALRFSGFVSDFNSGYVSTGYHFGKWLPYVLYGQYRNVNVYQIDEIPAPGNDIYGTTARFQQHTVSLGTRYQWQPNISLKLQADQVSGFNGEYVSGFFVPRSLANASTLKTAYVYSASLNATF